MEKRFFEINENAAKTAKEINSFSEYVSGSATAEYKCTVNTLYDVYLAGIKEKRPSLYDKALYMIERFSKKYADYLNAYYRNEASCPSVMICGPANFPVRKKERQNSRRETLNKDYEYLMAYKRKIENLLTSEQPILSADENAIEMLEDKIADLEKDKAQMIAINAFYRKNRTLEGLEEIVPDELSKDLKRSISFAFGYMKNVTEATGRIFDTSNTNAEIKRCRERLEKLKAVKEQGTKEEKHDGFSIIENSELMRLQIIFDEKPDEATRELLKSHGFKWAPSQSAWQRVLNDNAKYALKRVLEKIA